MRKIFQLGMLALVMSTCYNVGAQGQSQSDSGAMIIELKEYAVYHVQGKKLYKYRDNENKLKESKTAYLVTFTFATKLKAMNTRIDFYIGDYRIPEYGGTAEGIYFRFYDPKTLESLDGQTIYYQVANQNKVSLGKKFIKPDTKTMKVISEETVIKRKQ